MKAEEDKRNVRTSVTMTQNDSEIIAQNAKAKGMPVSTYMVLCSVRPNENTPETMAKYQNVINHVCRILEDVAPERIDEVRKEAEVIWPL